MRTKRCKYDKHKFIGLIANHWFYGAYVLVYCEKCGIDMDNIKDSLKDANKEGE